MSEPTQMEKLEEIVRALKRLAAYRVAWAGTMGPEEREHLDDIDIPRALTLARELRDNAVGGAVPIPVVMALCEQDSLILRPNVLYRFEPVDGCARCAEIMGTYAGHEWTTVGSTDPNP